MGAVWSGNNKKTNQQTHSHFFLLLQQIQTANDLPVVDSSIVEFLKETTSLEELIFVGA
jgi:hypothetical protein